MILPEAIVYLLASSNHGMKTDVIARLVNEKRLYKRWEIVFNFIPTLYTHFLQLGFRIRDNTYKLISFNDLLG